VKNNQLGNGNQGAGMLDTQVMHDKP